MAKFSKEKVELTPESRLSRIIINLPRENAATLGFEIENTLVDNSASVVGPISYEDPIVLAVDSVSDNTIELASKQKVTIAEIIEALELLFSAQYQERIKGKEV
jgi:hypothetical protein